MSEIKRKNVTEERKSRDPMAAFLEKREGEALAENTAESSFEIAWRLGHA